MEEFNHPHIIQLIGVCSEPPVYIIMELAPHGEVNNINSNNNKSISNKLNNFCCEIILISSLDLLLFLLFCKHVIELEHTQDLHSTRCVH